MIGLANYSALAAKRARAIEVDFLTGIYNRRDALTFNWDHRLAFIQVTPALVVLSPRWNVCAGTREPDDFRGLVSGFLAAPALFEMRIGFGELLCWANRRSSKLSGECSECELSEREMDRQRILGSTFDRRLIREAIQWLVEAKTDPLNSVHIRKVVSPNPKHNQEDPMLVMTCRDWTAIVMCCRRTCDYGSDRLPVSQ